MYSYYSQQLLQLRQDLGELITTIPLSAEQCVRALAILQDHDQLFRSRVATHSFPTPEEEIRYFKYERPELLSLIMYFAAVYDLEMSKPTGSRSKLRAFYANRLERADDSLLSDPFVIGYIRSGEQDCDEHFFLRAYSLYRTGWACWHGMLDLQQTTGFDIAVAQLHACDLLASYFEACLTAAAEPGPDDVSSAAPAEPAARSLPYGPGSLSPNGGKLLRSWQVERQLGISKTNLFRLRESGHIDYIQVGRTIWYRESDVQAFLAKNRHRTFDDPE